MSNRPPVRLVLVLALLAVATAATVYGYARHVAFQLKKDIRQQASALQRQGVTVHYTPHPPHGFWRPGLTLDALLVADSEGNGWSAARLDLGMSWLHPGLVFFHSEGTQRLRLARAGLVRMENVSGAVDTRTLHLNFSAPLLTAGRGEATPAIAASGLRGDMRLFPHAGPEQTHWILILDAEEARLPALAVLQAWQPRHIHVLLVGLNDVMRTLKAPRAATTAQILVQQARCDAGPLRLSAAGTLSAQGNGTLGLHASRVRATLRHFLAHPPIELGNPDAMALWSRLSAHDLEALPDALDLPLPINAWQPDTALPTFLQTLEHIEKFQNETKP